MKIAIISVTALGDKIINKLSLHFANKFKSLSLTVFNSKDKDFNFKQCCKVAFENNDAVIFISSTGIAVRGIAPHVVSKKSDPAVIVIDSCSKYAISLLSGHLGGANNLTKVISEILGCEAIITTATDNLEVVAPDMIAVNNNLYIENMDKAKEIAALLVEGKAVGFIDEEEAIGCPKGYLSIPKNILAQENTLQGNKEVRQVELETQGEISKGSIEEIQGLVIVTSKKILPLEKEVRNMPVLKLIRKHIILGIGCKKNFSPEEMKLAVKTSLDEKNISEKAVASIATVSIKKEEVAILNLSKSLGVEISTFTPEEIKPIEHKYKTSDFVRKTLGVGAVCEPVIELAQGKVIHEKESFNGMTLAIGKID
ncbi:cobalt-precorrin 5A hydrolase [Clostridium tunisiense]|uniref:cobalt-precorrin 5A hydrolase n=1 Tax=Clostridium tunisiense TaxID=219748 RepID=UPI0002DA5577|nr:cobalt-precorrin 5A hydrolase [Clostridium tunisiense]